MNISAKLIECSRNAWQCFVSPKRVKTGVLQT
jgi:hypothetical protein